MLRATLLLTALLAVVPASAQQEEAVTVFDRVNPSVVSLESVLDSGTGVLISKDGLILTNAHVVAAPLSYSCKVDVQKDGRLQTVIYQKVEIVGLHPVKDLALVRIDPREHNAALTPAKIQWEKARTGQRVYAIGNPASAGVSLNKTITSGLLSGVDREIEEVKYYQIDAAINPGNSGGPLCDRNGNVLGLVTLKLTDAENIGFAIPLHDLKTSEFQPKDDKPIDVAKSDEFIEASNQVAAKYYELKKQGKEESLPGEVYKYLTVQLLLQALLYNPTNPDIYWSVGMWLRDYDAQEAALEFFHQALERAPWPQEHRVYRELGVQLAIMKRSDDAVTVWREGAAKYPVDGAQLWEDLAIEHRDRQQWAECARCAAMQLRINSPDTRQTFAREVIDRCRAKVAGKAGHNAMEQAIAGASENLHAMVESARQALARRQVALTQPFADYLRENHRQLDPARITATSIAGLSPASSAARPGVARISSNRPAPRQGSGASSHRWSRPTSRPKSEDVMAAIDAAKLPADETWRKTDSGLIVDAEARSHLPLPIAPSEYDMTLRIERKRGEQEFVVAFLRGGKTSLLMLDLRGSISGVYGLRENLHHGATLPLGEVATVQLQVRDDRLRVLVGGEAIIDHASSAPLPGVPEAWQAPSTTRPAESTMFLGARGGAFHIHDIELRHIGFRREVNRR